MSDIIMAVFGKYSEKSHDMQDLKYVTLMSLTWKKQNKQKTTLIEIIMIIVCFNILLLLLLLLVVLAKGKASLLFSCILIIIPHKTLARYSS